jgi:GT2 family glycosyltransferase
MPPHIPLVSVHIVTYNSAATIDQCLEALLAQQSCGYGVDFGVYVIDNASTDDTVQRVQKFDVPLVINSTNLGYAVAHNQAIDATSSHYVLTLNPDVWLGPGYLKAMIPVMEADLSFGSAAGCLLRVERLGETPHVIDGLGLYMRRSRRQGLRGDGKPSSERAVALEPIFGPDGAAAFYRRTMLDDIRIDGEVFDADFFMHKEDVDLCWRAQLRGWSSVYVPDAVAHHVRGFRPGQRERVSPAMRFYGTRNRYLLMLKNEQLPHFLRDLWTIAPYDLGILLYVVFRERTTLRAYRSLIGLIRRMMRKRRMIQKGRRVRWRDISRWFRG